MIDLDYYIMGGPEGAEWVGCPRCHSKTKIIVETTGRNSYQVRCINSFIAVGNDEWIPNVDCGWTGEIRECWTMRKGESNGLRR